MSNIERGSRPWPVLALLAATLAAACAPVPVRLLSDYAVTPGYARDEVEAALRGQVVRVTVQGDPFGLSPEAFAGQVAASMEDAGAIEAGFASRDGTPTLAGWAVIWRFAPPRALAPDAICAGGSVGGSGRARPIDAYVALCRDGRALTAVRARLHYTDTPGSLEFIALVDETTRALFPVRPPVFRRAGGARLAPQVPHVAR